MIPDRRQNTPYRDGTQPRRPAPRQNGTRPHRPDAPPYGHRKRRRNSGNRDAIITVLAIFLMLLIGIAVCVLIAKHTSAPSPEEETEVAQTANAAGMTGTLPPVTAEVTEPVTEADTSPHPDSSGVFIENLLYAFPVSTYSRYGILIDLTDNTVIAQKNADVRTYPASVTKIMTVIVAMEQLDSLDEKALITQDLLLRLAARYASVAGFQAGEWVSARDLMYAALLPSGADGSVGLAELVSGTEEEFAVLMNEKAAELGMTGTHFVNATGLHEEDHYSTCRDLAILLKYALQNAEFRKIFTTKTYRASDGLPMVSTTFNGMEKAGLQSQYILGGKTGYTPEAGVCLASLAGIGDHEYIMITLGAGTGTSYPKYNLMDAVSVYKDLAAFLSTDSGKAA